MSVPPDKLPPQTLSAEPIAQAVVTDRPLNAQGIAQEPMPGLRGEQGENDPDAALPGNVLAHRTFWYCIANLGYGMFFALNNASLTLFLNNMGARNVLIGLMGSSHSLEGAVIQPLIGAASDRLHSPLGRRRPFMLAFAPLSALFLLLTPAASHLPLNMRLGVVVLCIFLFTVFFNVLQDPYMALMPDIIPTPQRGRVTATWTFVGVFGQAALVLLPIPLELKFSLVAIVMLVTTALTCWGVHESVHPPEEEGSKEKRPGAFAQIQTALQGLKTLHQARKALITSFFTGVGVGAVLPFLTIFVTKITHCSNHQAEQMFLVLMISTAVGVLPFGWLCDRIGPRTVLMIGLALIVLAAVNGLWVQTLPQVAVVLALAGLGNAAQSASAYPLLTRLVPGEEVGFYTGLQSTALSIAAPATSVITGLLVDQGSYRWIFVVCGISVAIAISFLLRVNVEIAAREVRIRESAPTTFLPDSGETTANERK